MIVHLAITIENAWDDNDDEPTNKPIGIGLQEFKEKTYF